jgi:drug/metabolite transporter (DMT)-like permease
VGLTLGLSLAAAILFAAGTVYQEKVAATASDEEAASAGFLIRLAKQPVWLLGIAIDAGGFVCQAAALGVGKLVVVQPILASSVVFALPLGRLITGQRSTRREHAAALAVTAGLALFLVIANPTGGRDDATPTGWIVSSAVIAAVSAVLVVIGLRGGPALKAGALGTAAGVLFALSAAITKATVDQLDEGILHVFTDWHLYALIVVGYASMTISQTSLQTGRLGLSVATQMSFDPVASVVLGLAAFGETLHVSAGGAVASGAALLVMLGGLVVLTTARADEDQATSPTPPPPPSPAPVASAPNRSAA